MAHISWLSDLNDEYKVSNQVIRQASELVGDGKARKVNAVVSGSKRTGTGLVFFKRAARVLYYVKFTVDRSAGQTDVSAQACSCNARQ